MELMSVEEFPEAAESVVIALQSNELLEDPGDFSAAEIAAFQDGISQGMSLVIGEDTTDISLERLFVARALVASLPFEQDKDFRISQMVPDIPRACQMLEKLVEQVIQDVANESENEDRLAMTFNQLVELIVINGVQEEGSRRLFVSCMQSLIVNVVTPDVLIPHCLKALSKCARDQSFALNILDRLDEQTSSEEIKDLVILRWLTVASNVLDSVSLDVDPRPHLDHDNPCVQLAAVECLGKLGLYRAPAEPDQQLLLDMARDNGTDSPELHCHAAMVLSDWSLVTKEGMDETFRSLLSNWMHQKGTLVSNVACEIAMKQLQSKAVCDSDWICTLVIKFFEQSGVDEDEDNARLQQLLALFFPTMVRVDRDSVIGCVHALLDRNRKLSAVKMVQYIVQTASTAETTNTNDGAEINNVSSSAELMVAVQIASFLSESSSDVTKTLVRSLCKMMDGWEWDIERELYEHLSVLKELLDELLNNDVIEDKTSLAHLQTCFARLEDVEMEDQVEDDVDDDETVDDDITQGMGKLNLEKEQSTDVENKDNGSVMSSGAKGEREERRHSRRLRPSN